LYEKRNFDGNWKDMLLVFGGSGGSSNGKERKVMK